MERARRRKCLDWRAKRFGDVEGRQLIDERTGVLLKGLELLVRKLDRSYCSILYLLETETETETDLFFSLAI